MAYALTESNWFGPRAARRDAAVLSDPVGFILGIGIGLGQLAIAVLGVLVITSEYSTGVIRASLLAVPRPATGAGRQGGGSWGAHINATCPNRPGP